MNVEQQAGLAKSASLRLATLSTEIKNKALSRAADALDQRRVQILEANALDLELAQSERLSPVLTKRLGLDNGKIDQIVASVRDVVRLPDPVGRTLLTRELDHELILTQSTVPLGVIGVIFESRPDALVQISSLCLKSGNAVILKGGREAARSNRVLYEIVREAVEFDPVFTQALQLVETREEIQALLKLDDRVDLMIPRGSNELVRTIQAGTKIPVLGHSDGICHLYIDRDADLDMAVDIAYDAKCQYPAVCNAIETLLVHRDQAETVLPRIAARLDGVELRGDEPTCGIISVKAASDADWDSEYNDLILAVKVVGAFEEAIDHINTHGSRHTDAIVTENIDSAERFMAGVDASSVMWNASTRFADGFRYGLGAEVGIATGKIHARGPVGLEGLTTTKYTVAGRGQKVADYAAGLKTFTHKNLT